MNIIRLHRPSIRRVTNTCSLIITGVSNAVNPTGCYTAVRYDCCSFGYTWKVALRKA